MPCPGWVFKIPIPGANPTQDRKFDKRRYKHEIMLAVSKAVAYSDLPGQISHNRPLPVTSPDRSKDIRQTRGHVQSFKHGSK